MPKGVYLHKKGRIITWGNKISKANLGRKFSIESRKKMSKSHLGLPSGNKGKIGYKHTEEARRRIGLAAKGNSYCLGKKASLETRKKMSKSFKGRTVSLSTREKIRRFMTGRKRPELLGENNPMFTHPNSYKSKFGKTGFRKDLKIFVRSRWEANIIRIFKFLGFNIQYEPQSFRLSNGETYRPDLFLHETGELIEIKGRWLKNAKNKVRLFKNEYPGMKLEIIDKGKYKKYIDEFSNLAKLEVA